LAVCNLPDGRVELFNVAGGIPIRLGDVPVGVDPVSLRFRTADETVGGESHFLLDQRGRCCGETYRGDARHEGRSV
jgi:hypothetical protein